MSGNTVSPKIYQVFKEDLERRMQHASDWLATDANKSPHDRLKQIGAEFHTIRGGAGFLGFEDIAGTAAQIEQILLKTEQQVTQKVEAVKSLFEALKEQVRALPTSRR